MYEEDIIKDMREHRRMLENLPVTNASDIPNIETDDCYNKLGIQVIGRYPEYSNINEKFLNEYAAPFLPNEFNERPYCDAIFDANYGDNTGTRFQFDPNKNSSSYKRIGISEESADIYKSVERYCYGIVAGNENQMNLHPSMLYSPGGTGIVQIPHRDLAKYYEDECLIFVALQDETTLCIYPTSHLIVRPNSIKRKRDEYERLKSMKKIYPMRIRIRKGDILKFHPNLLHCGDKYASANIRLHYYVTRSATRPPDETVVADYEVLHHIMTPERIGIVQHNLQEGLGKYKAEKKRKQLMNTKTWCDNLKK